MARSVPSPYTSNLAASGHFRKMSSTLLPYCYDIVTFPPRWPGDKTLLHNCYNFPVSRPPCFITAQGQKKRGAVGLPSVPTIIGRLPMHHRDSVLSAAPPYGFLQ
jgi:hypothetical protein